MRLTDEDYWNLSYKNFIFQDIKEGAIFDLLSKYLDKVEGKSSLEIGSFPGTLIPIVGRKGYIVHGVDYNSRNGVDLPNWLKSLNLQVGKFWVSDFFTFKYDVVKRFDLVTSFGFIEHFENFDEVIKEHLDLVVAGGKVIITTPNFKGWMQYLPHRIFDNENLKNHFLKSMNPSKWKKILEANGFEVKYYGFFGSYLFWVDPNQKRSKIQKYYLKQTHRLIYNLNKVFQKFKIESNIFSAFCGIVAVKKNKISLDSMLINNYLRL